MVVLFQYALLSMVLLSMTSYVYISYKSICENKWQVNLLVDKLISTALLSILFSLIFIMRGIFFSDNMDLELYKGISFRVVIIALVIFLTVGICGTWVQHKYNYQKARSVLSPILITLLAFILPVEHFPQYYYAMVSIFTVMVAAFTWKIFIKLKMTYNIGVYFIGGGTAALAVSSLFSIWVGTRFFNVISLALLVFIMFGFFLFFVMYFLFELENRYKELNHKDLVIQYNNQKIEDMAFKDEVTGILNRASFERDLTDTDQSLYLCMFNIRNFMGFNNLLGFNRGSLLLQEIALEISMLLPSHIKLYRYYSDRFLVMIPDESRDRAYEWIKVIQDAFLNKCFQGISVNAYFGVYGWTNKDFLEGEDPISEALSALEIASEVAKGTKEGIYEYTASDSINFNKQTNLEIELRKAIKEKCFIMYYQPQVDKSSHDICAFEALIRWKLEGQFISPAEFIPLAENKGLMSEITRQVIQQVFKDVVTESAFSNKMVAINLSVDQLVEESFLDFVAEICSVYPVYTPSIIFEITETVLFNDVKRVNVTIEGLKKLGFQISLDDFGDGYSSIYRFAKLDLDEVKFDKVFISDLHNKKTYNTFKKTAELFKSFDMRIVVEGIENQTQLDYIMTLPIDVLQGFYFYRPMPIEEIRLLPLTQ